MGKTRRLTVAQATVEFLTRQFVERDGVQRAFFAGILGIFGHGNVAGIGEALEAGRERVRYFQARNEQAMVHVATAFARQSRRLRAFACTSSIGPGATNMVTGAATATINRLPVLLLPGDIFASRRVWPVLQQLEDQRTGDISVNDALRPVCRYWDRINRPEQLLHALPAAMRVLTSPSETGAVTIALPQDVQAEAFDFPSEFFEPRIHVIPRTWPDREQLARAAERIAASRAPLLIAGGGVLYSEAEDALARLAATTGIPVAETQAGKSALRWDDPAAVGPVGVSGGLAANRLARDADVVIAVGTRLTDFPTASLTAFANPAATFIGLNVVEFDAAKLGALPLVADARVGLEAIAEALAERGYTVDGAYRERVAALRTEWIAETDRLRALDGRRRLTQAQVIGIVNDTLGPDATVVCAAGSLPGDLLKLWRSVRPGSYHVEYGYSCMGYEIAGGLGARLADPDHEVVVIVGDGSYLMLASEITTAIQEGIRFTIVVLDNHGYGCIHGLSRQCGGRNDFNRFRYRLPATGDFSGAPLPIDLAANAASLGARAVRAGTAAELSAALADALTADRTTVVVVEIDEDAVVPSYDAWWDVPIAEVSSSPTVREARAAYEVARARQRHFFG